MVFAEKLGAYASSTRPTFAEDSMPFTNKAKSTCKTVATLEFSSERKCMSTVIKGYQHGKGGNTVLLKGAFEKVIQKCNKRMGLTGDEVAFDKKAREQTTREIEQVAAKGFRVLGVAIGLDGGNMKHINEGNVAQELEEVSKYDQLESDLTFVGYVCIKDPVRPEVRQSIQDCRTAGINVIMITGDSKETAIAIARELNIITKDQNTENTCFTG